MIFLRQSAVIIFAFCFILILRSISTNITVPFIGIMIAFYIVISKIKTNESFNLFILISLVLILVFSTGAMASPFFFLLYFLSFGIAFIFDPKSIFVFTLGLVALLFPEALKQDLTRNLILLFSFILLSPLAFFTGIAFQQNQENKRKIASIKEKTQKIENDIEDILYDDEEKLDLKASTKLNQALEEAEDLAEISDKK